jgi:DNA-binding winged helix-turn-helix (wHTH) protein/Tol biopolymer transport system component
MRAVDRSPLGVAERERLPVLAFGPFAFDTHTRLLTRDGEELALPPRVLGVLELLLARAGDVVPRQDLIDTVWKDAFVTDTSLAEAVSVLRQVLGDDPQSPTYIQTRHRRGYRFVAQVTIDGEPTAALKETPPQPTPAAGSDVGSPSIGGQLVPWSAAVICSFIAIVAVWQMTRHTATQSVPAARFTIAPVAGTSLDSSAPALAVSSDGQHIAWSACDGTGCRLYVRPLDRLDSSIVAGTDGAHAPFFSPDGRWIAFFADGRLKKVAIAGGTPATLADAATPLGGVWIDREIVFAGSPSGGLMRVSSDGGEPHPLTVPNEHDGEVHHAWPSLVPGTRLVLFTIDATAVEGASGVMGVLSLDDSPQPRWRTLVAGVSVARAIGPDAVIFGRGNELQAIAFDAARRAISGAPRTALASVATAGGEAVFSLSQTGTVVYAVDQSANARGGQGRTDAGGSASQGQTSAGLPGPTGVRAPGAQGQIGARLLRGTGPTGAESSGGPGQPGTRVQQERSDAGADGQTARAPQRGLSWWAASGTADSPDIPDDLRELHSARLSPDGARVVGVKAEGIRTDIWVADVQRGAATRLTHSGTNSAPVWSADGRSIFYASRTDGPFEIWMRDADGARPATRLFTADRHALPLAASPDGRLLAFLRTSGTTRADIWSLALGASPASQRSDGSAAQALSKRSEQPASAMSEQARPADATPTASTASARAGSTGSAPVSSTGSGQARALVQGAFDERAVAFSPDSTLVAFESADTGRWEVYVQRIGDSRRVVVSTDGGERPIWTSEGLFYQSRGRVLRATIADVAGELRVTHASPIAGVAAGTLRGVSPTGRVLLDRAVDLTSASLVVGLDWRGDVLTLLGPPALNLPR